MTVLPAISRASSSGQIEQVSAQEFDAARARVALVARFDEGALTYECLDMAFFAKADRDRAPNRQLAKGGPSEACWKAAEAAMQTDGGFSYAKEYDIERKWREVRLYQIAPISTNLVLAYLGQHVLGMERSY